MTKLKNARDSQIACLNLTMDGLLLATASTKGTLIRIFNTIDGTKLQEVCRGVEKADIFRIALSPNVQWLAVSSDKGTVHLFSLRVRVVGEDSSTCSIVVQIWQWFPTIHLPLMLLFLQVSVPILLRMVICPVSLTEYTKFIAPFGSQNTVIIVGMAGSNEIVFFLLFTYTVYCTKVAEHSSWCAYNPLDIRIQSQDEEGFELMHQPLQNVDIE
ncbi:hypothetical protein HYC85_009090 [Camellia sinensis]|uniref:Autophagy-related protein 18a n=1 Tax=Camellia sinensis TaxID=4442 RepID=A0A7J7HGX6_CAMSI|nr:hypothetical protein HYC85_009090 [Camellia sinensis]